MKYILITLFWACCNMVFAAVYTYSPSQLSAIKTQLNGNLNAGDTVYLDDGVYTDFQVSFRGNGSETSPVTLKAKNPGKAILTGKLNLKISGNYLVVDGLVFKDGEAASGDIVEFRTNTTTFANNCRMTNCVMDNCNTADENYYTSVNYSERWVMIYGKNNRIDHCYFANKLAGGVLMMVSLGNINCTENNHIIEYNFFGNRQVFAPGNNAETIRIGDSNTSQLSSQTVIRNNFFYTCDGEPEIVSIKSCDNLIAQNVFYESAGAVVCRHGHRNTVEENVFIGNNKANCGGVRVINKGQQVRNNFLQEIAGTGNRSALCVMMGIFEVPDSNTDIEKEPLNAYHHVTEASVSSNTFINCKNIDLGTNVSYTYDSSNKYYPGVKVTGTLKPECAISDNIFYNPSTNTILNEVAGNVSDITYAGNVYMFKSTVNKQGFTYQSMNYQKIASGDGKGIYTLNGASVKPFTEAGIKNRGVAWYAPQQSDVNVINSKTDFWETGSAGIKNISRPSVKYVIENQTILISSANNPVESVILYDLQGKTVKKQNCSDYSCQMILPDLIKGIYILTIHIRDGDCYTKKVFL